MCHGTKVCVYFLLSKDSALCKVTELFTRSPSLRSQLQVEGCLRPALGLLTGSLEEPTNALKYVIFIVRFVWSRQQIKITEGKSYEETKLERSRHAASLLVFSSLPLQQNKLNFKGRSLEITQTMWYLWLQVKGGKSKPGCS